MKIINGLGAALGAVLAASVAQAATPASGSNTLLGATTSASGSSTVTYVYDNVFVPGSGSNSFISGITDSGDALVNSATGVQYIYSPTSGLTALPQPAASSPYFGNTAAYGINDSGTVVGTGCNCPGNSIGTIEQGFILQNGNYTFFSYPGATNTIARSISASGLVTGYDNVSGGFVYNPATNTFTAVYPPGTVSPAISYANSIFNQAVFTPAQGITASGQIVGSALLTANNPNFNPQTSPGFFSGYVYNENTNSYSVFQVDSGSTQARGINGAGVITGFVTTTSGTDAFVGTVSGGFQLLSDPSATSGTFGEAINSSGQIAGTYETGSGSTLAQLGFIATPAEGASSTHNGAYTFNISGVGGTVTYLGPLAAAPYQYQTGAGNPNFASVVLPIGFDATNSFALSLCNGTSLGTIAGGQTYTFAAGGVSCFDVTGISGVTAGDANALVTGLTFESSGSFTGTVDPFTSSGGGGGSGVPEPGTLALFCLGLATLGFLRGFRRPSQAT